MSDDDEATTPTALRQRLQAAIGPVLFLDLRAHLDRQAVFVVGRELALVDVAQAIACDRAQVVAMWVQQGALRRPSNDEVQAWGLVPDCRFMSVIVRPYVLIQPLHEEA